MMVTKFTKLTNSYRKDLSFNMYLIELIVKKLTSKKEKPEYNKNSEDTSLEYENCEHIFMPVDSTGDILSCTKCGFLAKRSEAKNKNFFIQENNLS